MTGLFSTVLNMSLIGSFTADPLVPKRENTPVDQLCAVGSGVDPSVGTGILFRTGEPVFPAAFPPCGYGGHKREDFPAGMEYDRQRGSAPVSE